MKQVLKSGLLDRVLAWARFKQTAELKKAGGATKRKISGIPKLDDANNAGSAKSDDCTLILTEGDSAKVRVFNVYDGLRLSRSLASRLSGATTLACFRSRESS